MWALHNSLKGWTLFSLSEREVNLLLNAMTPNEAKLAYICDSQKLVWESLVQSQFIKGVNNEGKTQGVFPPFDKSHQNQDIDTDYFVIRPQKVFYPRLYQRVDLQIPVSIECGNQVFSTETMDLSEGGIHFKEVLPVWISGYFIVKLKYKDRVFQLMCSLIEEQIQKKRVQIVSEESDPRFQEYRLFLHDQSTSGKSKL